VVTALCFAPLLFVGPLVAIVPPWATAPVLIVVGALMFRAVTKLDLANLEDALPAFLAVVLIPLTFSITQGILWAFLAHVVLYVLAGRRTEVARGTWALAALAATLIVVERMT
jgi:AGZA family xanthine/uracil permease-like MFS transporter